MLKKILAGLVVLIAGLLALISTRPDTFRLERSTVVAAAPGAVFVLVNDFHRWQAWSPWDRMDPSMKRTYEGPSSGLGASYSWVGNSKVGEGRMTIVDSRAPGTVGIDIEFLKPMAARNAITFTAVPTEGGTRVTWAMTGQNNFVAKGMQLVMDMDRMVGPDFERGLASLKQLAEATPAPAPAEAGLLVR
jgi:hypothetical protein